MIIDNGIEALELDSQSVRLERVELSGYEIKGDFSSPSALRGRVLGSAVLGKRDVKIEGYISAGLEENRRKIARICTHNPPFYLIDGEYRLELVSKKGIELSAEKRFSSKLLKFTLYAEATNPLWQSITEKSVTYSSCAGISDASSAIYVTNEGDAPVGFVAQAKMRTLAEGAIFRIGDKRITLDTSGLEIGDIVSIDTRYGKKSVTLIKKSTGASEDFMLNLAVGSELFELDAGVNRIDYSVPTGFIQLTITYNPVYMR